MHHRLPQTVREAISHINQAVSHETAWGYWTQTGFPGECRWAVTGGHDWPVPIFQDGNSLPSVSVLANNAENGTTKLEVNGLELVSQAILERKAILDDPKDDDVLRVQNEVAALEEVLVVLMAANVKES